MLSKQEDLRTWECLWIAVSVKNGDIFNKEYMATLQQITDGVYLPGVDRANLKSRVDAKRALGGGYGRGFPGAIDS